MWEDRCRLTRVSGPGVPDRHPPQGPVIPQQQHERQGNYPSLGHQAEYVEQRDDPVASHARLASIPAIGAQREQEKQHAQQVLAFGDPNHRFDIDGVKGKQGSHHQTAAGVAGCLPQDPKQQHGVQRMQEQIGVVVAGRVELKKLVIQGVRKPGQGMPVGRIVGGKRPCDRLTGQTRFHVDVIGYILVVVVINEGVVIPGSKARALRKRAGGREEISTAWVRQAGPGWGGRQSASAASSCSWIAKPPKPIPLLVDRG
jgi:hypothetical protein